MTLSSQRFMACKLARSAKSGPTSTYLIVRIQARTLQESLALFTELRKR
jgi:hypothetical protein